MNIFYLNGSYSRANKLGLKEVQEVMNGAVIMAINEGFPYRGTPEDMAKDALNHLIKDMPKKTCLFPAVYGCNSGTDREGIYTNEVAFQGVCLLPVLF